MKVLVIVDLLLDFCEGGALAVPEGSSIVPIINNLMENGQFDAIVAVNDMHPEDHSCFAANHPGYKPFDRIVLDGIAQTLWPKHCIPGTKGAEFHPALKKHLINKIIPKGTDSRIDSLSGFFDLGGKKPTGLDAFLVQLAKERGLNRPDVELFVCGLATDYCAGLTAKDGASLGYQTALLVDACRGLNAKGSIKMLREIVQMGTKVIHSRELLKGRSMNLKGGREIQRSL